MVLSSCGSAKQVRLSIRPALDMNGSRSCYVLARTVEEKAFSTESYDDVAAKAMAPDDSVQDSVPVLPGRSQELTVLVPEKGRIALYAMLGQPEDDRWRVLLPASPPAKVELRVERGRLCWTSEQDAKDEQGRCGPGPMRR
jgi:hypothetical protein